MSTANSAATNDFDVAVVGRGMIGAAAARYLAEAGQQVVLVGSGEPVDYSARSAVFSSHYDEGRITRVSDANAIWSELAARSIQRYGDIASRSGIAFHDPVGLAQASSVTNAAVANANQRGGTAHEVSREWLYERTGIAIRDSHPGGIFFEDAPAGTIHPRKLVAAQVALAVAAGAIAVDAPAKSLKPRQDGVVIKAPLSISASKVLLATGAYGAELLDIELDLERRLRTIVLAELGPGPEIPALINDDALEHDLDGMYWVPPRRFPDGRTMLKIGGNSLPLVVASESEDIAKWFRGGGSRAEAGPMQRTVRSLLPQAEITSWDHKPCVLTNTPSGLPYLGFIDERVAVAVGGNGAAAKSSDEIGRLAAQLISGGWNDQVLDEADFAPRTT